MHSVSNTKLNLRPPCVSRAAVCCRRAQKQNSLWTLPFQPPEAFNRHCKLIYKANINQFNTQICLQVIICNLYESQFKHNTKSRMKYILQCHGRQGRDLFLHCTHFLHDFVFRLEMALITEICCYWLLKTELYIGVIKFFFTDKIKREKPCFKNSAPQGTDPSLKLLQT